MELGRYRKLFSTKVMVEFLGVRLIESVISAARYYGFTDEMRVIYGQMSFCGQSHLKIEF